MNTRSICAPSNSAIFWNSLLIVISLSKGSFSNQICCGTAICNRYSIAEIHGNPACEIRHVVPLLSHFVKAKITSARTWATANLSQRNGSGRVRSENPRPSSAKVCHCCECDDLGTVGEKPKERTGSRISTAANQHRKQSFKVKKHPQAKEGCLVLPLNSALFPCHVTLAERAPICLGWPNAPWLLNHYFAHHLRITRNYENACSNFSDDFVPIDSNRCEILWIPRCPQKPIVEAKCSAASRLLVSPEQRFHSKRTHLFLRFEGVILEDTWRTKHSLQESNEGCFRLLLLFYIII